MTIAERIEKVVSDWFIQEPAIFSTWCTHHLAENAKMACPVRCGKGRIEYNPQMLEPLNDQQLKKLLFAEVVRILLKHPYERQPENCQSTAITMGSNCVLSDNYDMLKSLHLESAQDFRLNKGQTFEYYAQKINSLLPPPQASADGEDGEQGDSQQQQQQGQDGQGDQQQDQQQQQGGQGDQQQDQQQQQQGQGGSQDNQQQGQGQSGQSGSQQDNERRGKSQQSELWEEDQMMQETINDVIQQTTSWGSIPDNMVEQIIASTKPHIDYRRAFSGFRASILSSKRHLTRMRPNRRAEFEQMGSVYELSTRMLVAVDVSGSVSTEALGKFYGLINRFFKYGIENVDVVQFDADLGEVRTLKKAQHAKIEVCGRGGTSFQPAINFAKNENYDGLVFLTDGYAPVPRIPKGFHTPLLWVLETEREYTEHKEWMEKLPHSRSCFIQM